MTARATAARNADATRRGQGRELRRSCGIQAAAVASREAGAHEPSVHIPFGSGPRICPGRVHALLEMKMLLAMLYKTFDVERAGEANSVRERNAFVMTPVGVRVRLRRRSRTEAVSRGEMRALRPSAPFAPAMTKS